MSIPTPDPIVTTVVPDRESRRNLKREDKFDADQTQREILDDIYRYRGQLADTIDELHTRLDPKYHIEQIKEEAKLAGKDALGIIKGEGKPVDETRAKNAENLVKGGSAVAGFIGLRMIRKGMKSHQQNRKLKRALAKVESRERFEVSGLMEEAEPLGHDTGLDTGPKFPDAKEIADALLAAAAAADAVDGLLDTEEDAVDSAA